MLKEIIIKSVIPILYIVIGISFILINKYYFAGIIDVYFTIAPIIIGITITLLLIYKDSINKKYIIKNVALIMIIVISFMFILPDYSYQNAKEAIESNLQKNSGNIQWLDYDIKTLRSNKPLGLMINSGYVFVVNIKGETSYILFNPVTGDYFFEKTTERETYLLTKWICHPLLLLFQLPASPLFQKDCLPFLQVLQVFHYCRMEIKLC